MKRTYISVCAHTDDATFRAWRDELIAEVLLAGMLDAGDTGTVGGIGKTVAGAGARPGTNAMQSYMMFKTPDSTLFVKMEFGTGGSASIGAIAITVGKASDGAGSITGQASTRVVLNAPNPINSTVTGYATYISVKNGFFGLAHKANAMSNGGHMSTFMAGCTVDNVGALTNVGFAVWGYSSSAHFMQCVRTADHIATMTSSGFYATVPGNPTSSLTVDAEPQAYLMWMNMPEMLPFFWGCVVVKAELPFGTLFPAALVGVTAHDYLALSYSASSSSYGPANSNGAYGYAMIWEDAA